MPHSSQVLATPAERGLAPVAPNERIEYLDVLRGIALFGVLWSNLNDTYGTLEPASALARVLSWTQDWLIEQRFYTLLGFLFGMGFAIQLARAEQKGQDGRSLFYRRMVALLGFALVHGFLIWKGDVLVQYALRGFALVMYRRLSPRQLLTAAAVTYVIPGFFAVLIVNRAMGLPGPISLASSPQAVWIYSHGALSQIASLRVHEYLLGFADGLFDFNRALVLFLLGLWAYRVDLVSRLRQRRRLLACLLAAAVMCAVLGGYLGRYLPAGWPVVSSDGATWRDLRFWSPQPVIGWIIEDLLTWGNAAAYAIALLLVMSFSSWAKRLEPLAAVGRMTLTTYLTQSLICTTLFYSYGLGWYGRVSFVGMFAITVIVFSLQIATSVWWLRHFRFGPAEWLWRTVAYGKVQPLRLVPGRADAIVAVAAADPPGTV